MEKELLVFENLPKGKEFRPISETLTEEKIRKFCQAIDTENPLYRKRSQGVQFQY